MKGSEKKELPNSIGLQNLPQTFRLLIDDEPVGI